MQSGVNNLDYNLIWNKFLERIKQEIQPVNYETWFEETKLIEIKNDYAKILVPMTLHKKHLKDVYNDIVTNIFNEITESNFNIIYITTTKI